MATWNQLKDHVRKRYEVIRDGADACLVAWRFPDKDAAPALHAVQMQLVSAFGEPWVVVHAEVCPGWQLDPRDALTHNATLAFGGLCLEDDRYLVRHAAALATLEWVDVERALELVAHEAARIRYALASTADAVNGAEAELVWLS